VSKYDPQKHHRRSIRLQGYDYAMAGAYFVTICTQDCTCLFGEILDGLMMLGEYGEIAREEWIGLGARFHTAIFDVFQIMPNHIHGIIRIVEPTLAVVQNTIAYVAPNAIVPDGMGHVGATLAVASTNPRAGASPAPTGSLPNVGNIIDAYKSLPNAAILESLGRMKG